ncbi:MAG: ATP-binding cassette domain-containing protein [Nevskia sp.]|nr:ATP-binding cassette domain-containing protein [Nevskia sp.]
MLSASDPAAATICEVEGLGMSFGRRLIQEDVSFRVRRGEIFTVMGGSGSGKSTLLRHMIGLLRPCAGRIRYGGVDYWESSTEQQDALRRRFGVLFQGGALFSAMTLYENVALPLQLYTEANPVETRALVRFKLGLVGLRGYEEFYPSEISGGMRKRAGLARALVLDPELLFLDEPSAGLDPVSSRRLDDLILQLRDGTGASIVVISHELPSLFAIGDNGIFLDGDSKRPIAHGSPKYLLEHCDHPRVQAFLRREPVRDAGTHDKVVQDR